MDDMETTTEQEYVNLILALRAKRIKTTVCFLYCEPKSVIGIKGRQELPPLGMLYLCAALHEVGVEVSVLPFENLPQIEDVPMADLYCLSITSTIVYDAFIGLPELLRAKVPNAVIIAGNVHPSIFPEETILELSVDGVLVGEGEFSMLKLISNKISGAVGSRLFVDVPGAVFFEQGRLFSNPPTYVLSLDVFNPPFRAVLSDERIVLRDRVKVAGHENDMAITIVTSRGCPFSCYFCANMNNGSIRYRSAKNIANELDAINDKYPIVDALLVMDETATLSVRHLRGWANEAYKRGFRYVLSTRGDELDIARIEILSDTGCLEVKLGLETGSPSLLKSMNKQLSLNKISSSLALLKDAGIQTKVFLMHGFPGESMSTTLETVEYLDKNRDKIDRAVLYQFTPLPGSYVYNNPEKFALVDKQQNRKRTIYCNNAHWWGTEDDYYEMKNGYDFLEKYVADNFLR